MKKGGWAVNLLQNNEIEKLEDYKLVERAIKYIEMNYKAQPTLDDIAESVHLSKYHFQRIFTKWAGISPTKFLQFITINHAKKLLSESKTTLDVSNTIGLSSTSRLYDLFVNFEAITPGEYKRNGKGLEITYGFHYTEFGQCLIALTERGICALNFINNEKKEEVLHKLKEQWNLSNFTYDNSRIKEVIEEIFTYRLFKNDSKKLKLLLKGTNFQIKVWEALISIPFGTLASYKDVAMMIGKPTASRAVGNAIAKNPIAYVIPCHRVIREIGAINNYRWGSTRKKIIIGWEASKINKDMELDE